MRKFTKKIPVKFADGVERILVFDNVSPIVNTTLLLRWLGMPPGNFLVKTIKKNGYSYPWPENTAVDFEEQQVHEIEILEVEYKTAKCSHFALGDEDGCIPVGER